MARARDPRDDTHDGPRRRAPHGPPAHLSNSLALGMVMLAHCPRCQYAAPLDVLALIARLGDVVTQEIRPRLRCRRCGYDGRDPLLGTCELSVRSGRG
jgi:hypothetical protein